AAIRRIQQRLDPAPVRRGAGVSIELEFQRDGAVEPDRAAPAAFFALPAERETLAEAEFGKDNDLQVGEGVVLNVDLATVAVDVSSHIVPFRRGPAYNRSESLWNPHR